MFGDCLQPEASTLFTDGKGTGTKMMDLILRRTAYQSWGIISDLRDENGQLVSVTLEHSFEEHEEIYRAKIDPGKYKCVRGTHRLDHGESIETFEITGVPGHSGVLFHKGNFNEDSDGCVLLGLGTKPALRMIFGSRFAFERFMVMQKKVNSFYLTVIA